MILKQDSLIAPLQYLQGASEMVFFSRTPSWSSASRARLGRRIAIEQVMEVRMKIGYAETSQVQEI